MEQQQARIAVKRISAGNYEVRAAGRTFDVCDFSREGGSDWHLTETTGGRREWWNAFSTKAGALAAISAEVLPSANGS